MSIKNLICALSGGIGAFLCMLLGGFTKDLVVLTSFMVIDLLTGIIVAAVFKKSKKTESGALNSKVTYKGILKKICELCFVVIANMLDMYLGTAFIRSGVIVGFIINELLSIVENAALMGIVSPALNSALDILKKEVKK
jgi:toxin secretion/phage lysis holin